MKRLTQLAVLACGVAMAGSGLRAQTAPTFIDQGIAAMGGEARLKALKSVTLEVSGHEWALEQSERPEGPWLSTYIQESDVRDYEHSRRWIESQHRNWTSPKGGTPLATVITDDVVARTDGKRWAPGSASEIATWKELQLLTPEHLLFTAKAAADLKVMPDETFQRVRHHVVSFTMPGKKIRVFLNAWTHLPTVLEIVSNDRWGVWGDVTERRIFDFWSLEAGGIMYPRQTSTEWNGFTSGDSTAETVAIDAPIDEAKFAIPDTAKAAYAQAVAQAAARVPAAPAPGIDVSKGIDVTDHVTLFPSGYNVSVIDQPDGLVILEATTNSAFSQSVIAAAEKKYPGKKVKAVVTTSDAWPHLGGVREYVARGIPIYALDLNISILTRVIKAPHTFSPDSLSKTPKAPIFHAVTTRTTIGTGATRMELIPVRGETGERMMMVWFPAAKVLYSTDLIQPDRTGKSFFFIEMPAEIVDAVSREKIDGVEKVFGMHLKPTPWADVVKAVADARK